MQGECSGLMKVLYRKPPEDTVPVHRNLDLVSILFTGSVCVPVFLLYLTVAH